MNAMDSIFLPRFTIGENAFDAFHDEMGRYGKKVAVIHGERAWKAAREYVVPALEKAGLTVWDSCANYLFFEGPKGLAARLEKGGILIRDCSNYPGLAEGYYRAAVRTHEENQILTEAVSQILQWF